MFVMHWDSSLNLAWDHCIHKHQLGGYLNLPYIGISDLLREDTTFIFFNDHAKNLEVKSGSSNFKSWKRSKKSQLVMLMVGPDGDIERRHLTEDNSTKRGYPMPEQLVKWKGDTWLMPGVVKSYPSMLRVSF